MKQKIELMMIAGEASGDELGAELANSIKDRIPAASFFGTPGPKMRGAEVESLLDSDDWSIVGIGAVTMAIPRFLRIKRDLRSIANERKPAAVILIDFPEFNLKLARALKNDGHRVIYYVSPQIWAWRKYRIRTFRRSVDLLLSILPFEKEWYAENGLANVEYVGNPIAGRCVPSLSRSEFCEKYDLDPEKPVVVLLPGSRPKEIKRHLPEMLGAGELVQIQIPGAQFVIAAADATGRELIESIADGFADSDSKDRMLPRAIGGDTINALNAADAAAVSSGTATLEAGIVGTPMAVVYKVPSLDYTVLKHFVKTPHIALINLIAGRRLVKELIQHEYNASNLATELVRLLDPSVNAKMRRELFEVTEPLRGEDAAGNAARLIVEMLKDEREAAL